AEDLAVGGGRAVWRWRGRFRHGAATPGACSRVTWGRLCRSAWYAVACHQWLHWCAEPGTNIKQGNHMSISNPLAGVALLGAVLFAKSADAAEYCVFYAANSTYYTGPSTTSPVYSYGPVSFVWDPNTGQTLSGYWTQRVVHYNPIHTYFNNVVTGSSG